MKNARNVCVLLLCAMACPVYAVIVPPNKCPGNGPTTISPSCCSRSDECERQDSGIIAVSNGQPFTVLGSEHFCDNCVADCPEVTPPPLACLGILEVSYAEEVSASVAVLGEVSGDVGALALKASLENSIGHSSQRSKTFSLQCGSNSIPACSKATYTIALGVLTGITKKVEHRYQWKVTTKHDKPALCSLPAEHAGAFPLIDYYSGGTRESTATGSSYGTASCKTVSSSSSCP